jgi:hypothetical protein
MLALLLAATLLHVVIDYQRCLLLLLVVDVAR